MDKGCGQFVLKTVGLGIYTVVGTLLFAVVSNMLGGGHASFVGFAVVGVALLVGMGAVKGVAGLLQLKDDVSALGRRVSGRESSSQGEERTTGERWHSDLGDEALGDATGGEMDLAERIDEYGGNVTGRALERAPWRYVVLFVLVQQPIFWIGGAIVAYLGSGTDSPGFLVAFLIFAMGGFGWSLLGAIAVRFGFMALD